MAESPIDKELEAIKAVSNALGPFDADARLRILQYATQHLKLALGGAPVSPPTATAGSVAPPSTVPELQSPKIIDIRTFRDQKQPTTDVQMAAIVAFYLAELAPAGERKDSIAQEDIEKYFKQAGHPLPNQPRFTLPNAKNAGYFESAGRGSYKLNAVGHNLVAHGLPKSADNGLAKPRTPAKKAKKPAKK